jgi:transcription elongation factor Elf1
MEKEETGPEPEIICPSCWHFHSKEKHDKDKDVVSCEKCGKKFQYERVVSIDYYTESVE